MTRFLRKPAPWAIVLLVAATAGALVLRGRADPDTPTDKGPDAALVAAEPKPAEEPAPAKPADPPRVAAEPGPGAESTGGKKAEAPKGSGDPKGAPERRLFLETIGTLTATHCYQTYLNIGLIADAKAKGHYSEKDAYKVLDSVLALLDTVERKLADLSKVDLDKDDRDSLEQIRKLSAHLRYQGKALQAYWESGREEDAAKYEDVRKDSWAAISRLLGFHK
jgi:hypothetical protein